MKKVKVSCVCMCVDCTLYAVINVDGSQSQAGGKVLAADTADVLYALRGLTHLWVRDKNSRSVPNFVLSFNYGQILKLSANDDIIQAYCENKVNNRMFCLATKIYQYNRLFAISHIVKRRVSRQASSIYETAMIEANKGKKFASYICFSIKIIQIF